MEFKDKESYQSIWNDFVSKSKICTIMKSSPSNEKVVDYIQPLQIAAMERNSKLLLNKFNDDSEINDNRPCSTCLPCLKSKPVNNINIEDDKNTVDEHDDKTQNNTKIPSSRDNKDIDDNKYIDDVDDNKYSLVTTEPDNNTTIPCSKKCFLITEVEFTYDQMLSLDKNLISTSAFKLPSTSLDQASDFIFDFIPDNNVMISMTES